MDGSTQRERGGPRLDESSSARNRRVEPSSDDRRERRARGPRRERAACHRGKPAAKLDRAGTHAARDRDGSTGRTGKDGGIAPAAIPADVAACAATERRVEPYGGSPFRPAAGSPEPRAGRDDVVLRHEVGIPVENRQQSPLLQSLHPTRPRRCSREGTWSTRKHPPGTQATATGPGHGNLRVFFECRLTERELAWGSDPTPGRSHKKR